MTHYHNQLLRTLKHRIRAQLTALPHLAVVFEEEAGRLHRHDQVRRLSVLGVEVMGEVTRLRRMESATQYGRSQAEFTVALVGFGIGALAAAVGGDPGRPLRTGIRFAADTLARSQPSGQVHIAVGPQGLPDEVEVIPVSRWAREQRTSEAVFMRGLGVRGYRLMEPETFYVLLNDVQEKILQGTVSLPVPLAALQKSLVEGEATGRSEVSDLE